MRLVLLVVVLLRAQRRVDVLEGQRRVQAQPGDVRRGQLRIFDVLVLHEVAEPHLAAALALALATSVISFALAFSLVDGKTWNVSVETFAF